MKVLDTDMLTHLFEGHQRTVERLNEEVAAAIISRIEILLGRFAMLLKAADGQELRVLNGCSTRQSNIWQRFRT